MLSLARAVCAVVYALIVVDDVIDSGDGVDARSREEEGEGDDDDGDDGCSSPTLCCPSITALPPISDGRQSWS